MGKSTYKERTKRVTVGVPKTLIGTIEIKLQFSDYATISELIRSLLRKWVNEEILEIKPIGKLAE